MYSAWVMTSPSASWGAVGASVTSVFSAAASVVSGAAVVSGAVVAVDCPPQAARETTSRTASIPQKSFFRLFIDYTSYFYFQPGVPDECAKKSAPGTDADKLSIWGSQQNFPLPVPAEAKAFRGNLT